MKYASLAYIRPGALRLRTAAAEVTLIYPTLGRTTGSILDSHQVGNRILVVVKEPELEENVLCFNIDGGLLWQRAPRCAALFPSTNGHFAVGVPASYEGRAPVFNVTTGQIIHWGYFEEDHIGHGIDDLTRRQFLTVNA